MKEFISQIFTKFIKCSSVQAKSFAIYICSAVWLPLSEPHSVPLIPPQVHMWKKRNTGFCVCFLVSKDI